MIKVVAKMTLKQGKAEEMKTVAAGLIAETVKEEGNIAYQLYQEIKNPEVVFFIEEWESNEALRQHAKSKHFKEAMTSISEMLDKEPEISVCSLIG